MGSESDYVSEDASGSGYWDPTDGSSPSRCDAGSGSSKLFIFNLARTVTDEHLAPLFAPWQPIYTVVCLGKKGTSRRFGFAKFSSAAAAQEALEALRGLQVHGREMDLKFAVALQEPDPASGVLPKQRAKLRAAAMQALSPRIAAVPPANGCSHFVCPLHQYPLVPAAASGPPLTVTPGSSCHLADLQPCPPGMPDATSAYAGLQPGLPGTEVHHRLMVRHAPGLGLDPGTIIQLVWPFHPLNIATSIDAGGSQQSSVLFAALQQAQAGQQAVLGFASDSGYAATTSVASLPVHQFGSVAVAARLQSELSVPHQYAFFDEHGQQPVPHGQQPAQQEQQLPPGSMQQGEPGPDAGQQQQREAVTMRPLYAAPRPPHLGHPFFSDAEAALAERCFVPSWDGLHPSWDGPRLYGSQTYQTPEAEPADGSDTEDEGDAEPDPRDIYAAIVPNNLNACFVTRALIRQLAPAETVLKATAVGDPANAPSVLIGAMVRVLIDRVYKLRQVASTFVKPDSGRLMLVLHDVNSPIPADHISNTNPLLPCAQGLRLGGGLPGAAEAELLEFQARLAYHGRRLFRYEVAATAWRLQAAEHWQREQAGKTGDDLRLAASQLRAMLCDECEVKWRRRSILGLDLGQETAAIASAFCLPWSAAASWMAQRSPAAKLAQAPRPPGGTPGSAERSDVTGEYQSRPQYSQDTVLGPQREAQLPHGSAARRSLLQGAADPAQHARFMAAAFAGQHPCQEQAGPAPGLPRSGAREAAAPAAARPPAGSSGGDSELSHGSRDGASQEGLQLAGEEEQLLAEAAAFDADGGDHSELPEFFITAATLGDPPPPAPGAAPLPGSLKRLGGIAAENAHSQNGRSTSPARSTAGKLADGARLAASLERRGNGRLAAVPAGH